MSSKKPIKLLISTDSGKIHTGLAETTRLVFKRLLSKYPGKYEIHQLGWFHSEHGPATVPWKIYSTKINDKRQHDPKDRYGQQSFEALLRQVNPDIVYSNGDLWCFEHILDSPSRNLFRFIAYYTIDGAPYWGNGFNPGVSTHWGSKLAKADRVVVLSEFGKETLQNSMPEMADKNIEVIYHPVDIDRFNPLTYDQIYEKRTQLYAPNIPNNAFIMGWVGRNQFRKMNYKTWELLHYLVHGDYIQCRDCNRVTRKEFDRPTCKSREVGKLRMYDKDYDYSYCWYCMSANIVDGVPKDDIYLWNHMNKTDPGWRFDDIGSMLNIRDKTIFTPNLTAARGIPPSQLAELIATWDCMIYLSGGEGFGIPAYEAMMAGIPVIYTDYSSHADFSQHGGYRVRCDMIPELNFSIHRAVADVDHAIEVMLHAYNNKDEIKATGLNGRKWCESRPLDGVVDQWDKVFTEMMMHSVGLNSTEKIYAQSI
jgi:glycosyltransferase involved in cell wall biosynthesis